MSVLAYPRIHFRGACELNPATCNNDDVTVNGDSVQVALRPELAALTDQEVLAWLTGGVEVINALNGRRFDYLRGGWNPMGNMSVAFKGAAVCAVTRAD